MGGSVKDASQPSFRNCRRYELTFRCDQRRLNPESIGCNKIKVNSCCSDCLQLLAHTGKCRFRTKAPLMWFIG